MDGLSIKKASETLGIPYANAKAVNKTFEKQKRTCKKHKKYGPRTRTKNRITKETAKSSIKISLKRLLSEKKRKKSLDSLRKNEKPCPIFINGQPHEIPS
jgi:hypothetical protein